MITMTFLRSRKRIVATSVLCAAAIITLTTVHLLAASGTQLADRSLTLSDGRAGQTAVAYAFQFQPLTTDPIAMVRFQICANDPFPDTPCTAPVGFDAAGATLTDQSGDTGFTLSAQSTTNELVLERTALASAGLQNRYEFSGLTNPTDIGTYYVRVQTFADVNLTDPSNGYGGIAFVINDAVDVQATVPPYLLFCVGVTVTGFNCNSVIGDYINFGEFDSRQASQASTQMLAATNAVDGYTIRVSGRTLTSGNNEIAAMSITDVSRPGTSQFGLNLRANSAPPGGQEVSGAGSGTPVGGYGQSNFFRFANGDVVAASTAPDDARKYTTTYVVNVTSGQAPGVYVSTMNYIALGSF